MKYKLKNIIDYFDIKNKSKIIYSNRMIYFYFYLENVCHSQILFNIKNTNLYDILYIVENITYFVNEIYKNLNERNSILKKLINYDNTINFSLNILLSFNATTLKTQIKIFKYNLFILKKFCCMKTKMFQSFY